MTFFGEIFLMINRYSVSNHKCWETEEGDLWSNAYWIHFLQQQSISLHPLFAIFMAYGEQSWSHAFPRVLPRIRTTPFVSFQYQIHLIIFHFWTVSYSFLEYSILGFFPYYFSYFINIWGHIWFLEAPTTLLLMTDFQWMFIVVRRWDLMTETLGLNIAAT